MIISSSFIWHLLVGAMYKEASEHFVCKIDALEAGKMGFE